MTAFSRTKHKLEPEGGLAPIVTTLRVVALLPSQVAKHTGVNFSFGSIHAWSKYRPKLTSYDIHCVRVGAKAMLA